MTEFSYKQYMAAFKKTPEKIKDVLFADETAQAIEKISSRQNKINKTFDISATLGYALVGLIPIKRFIQALQEDAGLNAETAKNVAHDVRAEIFASVAKELAAIQANAEKSWEEAHEQTAENSKQKTENSKREKSNNAKENKIPLPDESVVSEVFPAPEIDGKKFDSGLEKPKEGESDKRF